MADAHLEPFARTIILDQLVAQTAYWLIYSTKSPQGEHEAAIDVRAYQALMGCASAEMSSEDALENTLLELEVELERKYRLNPNLGLFVIYDDIKEAVARYAQ